MKLLILLAVPALISCAPIAPLASSTSTPDPCLSDDVGATFHELASIEGEFHEIFAHAWDLALAQEQPGQVRSSLVDLEKLYGRLSAVRDYLAPTCIQHIVSCDLEVMDLELQALTSLSDGCLECAREGLARASARDEHCTDMFLDFHLSRNDAQ